MQPVAEVVEHDAAVTPEHAHGPGLPQRLHLLDAKLLAPVPGGRLEAKLLRGRAGREEHHVTVGGADTRLVRDTAVGRHQPVAHGSGRPYRPQPYLPVEPGDEVGPTRGDPVDLGAHGDRYRVEVELGDHVRSGGSEAGSGERGPGGPVAAPL